MMAVPSAAAFPLPHPVIRGLAALSTLAIAVALLACGGDDPPAPSAASPSVSPVPPAAPPAPAAPEPTEAAVSAGGDLDGEGRHLSAEQESCLLEWGGMLAGTVVLDDPDRAWGFLPSLLGCAPDLFPPIFDSSPVPEKRPALDSPPVPEPDDAPAEPAVSTADDHGDTSEAATAVPLGKAVLGNIDRVGDADVFAFEAEAGVLYRIDVIPGTLAHMTADLSTDDGDGGYRFVASTNYGPGTLLFWDVLPAGRYYVTVHGDPSSGEDTGSYVLTIVAAENVDDHGDTPEAATVVPVGEAVPGRVDYPGDTDVFAFPAEAGMLYRVEVVPETLAAVTTRASNWGALSFGGHGGDGWTHGSSWRTGVARHYLPARWTTEGHIEVTSPGEAPDAVGSYTLTVVATALEDDHGWPPSAVPVGEAVSSAIDYPGDTDAFVFEAEAGVLYRIALALGTLERASTTLFVTYDSSSEAYTAFEFAADPVADLQGQRFWEAPRTGAYTFFVNGGDTGSYTVTVRDALGGGGAGSDGVLALMPRRPRGRARARAGHSRQH